MDDYTGEDGPRLESWMGVSVYQGSLMIGAYEAPPESHHELPPTIARNHCKDSNQIVKVGNGPSSLSSSARR